MTFPAPEVALALSRHDPATQLSGYDRLYFGAEFCSWAMPRLPDILDARTNARESGCSFTLMTPVLREETPAELEPFFRALSVDWSDQDEVLISDWGTLEVLRSVLPTARVILGRALSGQKRGPRIEALSLSEEAQDYFRQGSWYASEALTLLQELDIDRVELDNLLQGIAPLPKGLRGSLHYPWLMVTSSRNCPYHRDKSGRRCSVGCGEGFRLSTPQTTHPLVQAGNSQFIENCTLPDNLQALGIDRIVEHVALPR